MNLDSVRPYVKAAIGFVTPGVVALVAAVQDSSQGGSAVTGPEWVGVAAACVLTGGAVFLAPNTDPKGTHQAESTQPPERFIAVDPIDGPYNPKHEES